MEDEDSRILPRQLDLPPPPLPNINLVLICGPGSTTNSLGSRLAIACNFIHISFPLHCRRLVEQNLEYDGTGKGPLGMLHPKALSDFVNKGKRIPFLLLMPLLRNTIDIAALNMECKDIILSGVPPEMGTLWYFGNDIAHPNMTLICVNYNDTESQRQNMEHITTCLGHGTIFLNGFGAGNPEAEYQLLLEAIGQKLEPSKMATSPTSTTSVQYMAFPSTPQVTIVSAPGAPVPEFRQAQIQTSSIISTPRKEERERPLLQQVLIERSRSSDHLRQQEMADSASGQYMFWAKGNGVTEEKKDVVMGDVVAGKHLEAPVGPEEDEAIGLGITATGKENEKAHVVRKGGADENKDSKAASNSTRVKAGEEDDPETIAKKRRATHNAAIARAVNAAMNALRKM